MIYTMYRCVEASASPLPVSCFAPFSTRWGEAPCSNWQSSEALVDSEGGVATASLHGLQKPQGGANKPHVARLPMRGVAAAGFGGKPSDVFGPRKEQCAVHQVKILPSLERSKGDLSNQIQVYSDGRGRKILLEPKSIVKSP